MESSEFATAENCARQADILCVANAFAVMGNVNELLSAVEKRCRRCALPRQAATTVQNPRGSATLRLCVKGFFPPPRIRLVEDMQNFASGEAKFCHQENLEKPTFSSDRTFGDRSNPARTGWWFERRSTANSSCRLAAGTRPGPSRTAPGRFRTAGVAGSCPA